jgi:photosystem II stability/assembly factor-like uncharacterized protein/tetratricopeptide (TPR) repeat protein
MRLRHLPGWRRVRFASSELSLADGAAFPPHGPRHLGKQGPSRSRVSGPLRLAFGMLLAAKIILPPLSEGTGNAWRAAAAETPAARMEVLEDARLRAVAFIDTDRGWAVGDQGVIWRTSNAGRSWELQPSGVSCSLTDVFFVDSRHGWIVGGWTHPYTHQTTGVVLRTQDGGETWSHIPGMILPRLHRVRFFTPRDGVALGASSALFPSGIFRTIDGGRSWNLMPGSEARHSHTGDMIDMQSGSLAGSQGELVGLAFGHSQPARTPPLAQRDVRDLRLGGAEGWLVGDQGLVLVSRNGGSSWQFPEGLLPEGAQSYFDFRAVSVVDNHVWIVGAPGSSVFYSPDQGRHWERMSTDQPLPLDGVTFVDHRRGWAVGALGTILVTRDGGRTWRRQRGGADRAALLGIFSEPESTPWELFGWYSANEGYIGVVEHVNQRMKFHSSPSLAEATRGEEAMVAVGGSAAGTTANFPLPPKEAVLSSEQIWQLWNSTNAGRGRERMLEYLVRRIRQWRPEIVVTEDAGKEVDRVGHEINQLVLTAIQQAADPSAFTDHLTQADLAPWQVKKAFSRMQSAGLATVRLSSSQLATQLAASLDDFTAAGRGLVHAAYQPPPAQTDLRLLVNSLPQNVSQADLFAGLTLPPGGGARRHQVNQPPINLDELSRLTQKRRNLERLLSLDRAELAPGAAWLGQIEELTKAFSPTMAGAMLYQLAIRYQRQGQPALAADALQRLVELHPDHGLADSALLWLVRYYSSTEIGYQLQRQNFYHSQVAHGDVGSEQEAVQLAGYPVQIGPQSPPLSPPETAVASVGSEVKQDQRPHRALDAATYVSRTRPGLFAEPSMRLPIAAVQRSLGNHRDAEQFFQHLAASGLNPAWRSLAQRELWMRHAAGSPPHPTLLCHRTRQRPRLDGELDDEVWDQAEPAALGHQATADTLGSAMALFAYDDEFLFIAVRCEYAARGDYTRSNAPRTRDADLTQRDRVEILLDLDRDYATYYRLVVDHRGWTFEDCWGDASWNPQWFVANTDDGMAWTVELAIPWSELTSQPPVSRSSWALGLQRTVPELGFQSWTQPASTDIVPEGFGLLLFE